MKVVGLSKNQRYEIAHKCECGIIFLANERDLFVETNGNTSNDIIVEAKCPVCDRKFKINVEELPMVVVEMLNSKDNESPMIRTRKKISCNI